MRLLLQCLFFPPLFIILSCSTGAKKDFSLEDKEKQLWLELYQSALQNVKSKPEESCQAFSDLSKKNFVLSDLALIRAHQVCIDPTQLTALSDLLTDKSPYLATAYVETQLMLAEKSGNSLQLAKALRAQAMASDRVREKIKILERALPLAESDKELQADIQNRIYNQAPRLKKEKRPEDYYKIAMDYIQNREFDTGRSYLKHIYQNPGLSFEDHLQARKAYRNSFKTQQRREDYTRECERFTTWLEKQKSAEPKTLHESYIAWARSAWTQGDEAWGRRVLDRGEKKLRRSYSTEEIDFIRARMSEENGDFEDSIAHLVRAEAAVKGRTAFRDRLLFSKAWMYRKLNRDQLAAQDFENLKNTTSDPFDQSRYSFWLGKTWEKLGEKEKAHQEFSQLKDKDALGYYGLLAYRELQEELPPLPAQENSLNFLRALDMQTAQTIFALIRTNESDVLEKYLQLKVQDLRTQRGPSATASIPANAPPAVWLAYLKSYAAAGLYLPLFSQIGTLDPDVKTQVLHDEPALLFPRKFLEHIDPASNKFGVQAELILSIIRQESAFNPQARSPADAFGLMQVLPSVAVEQFPSTGIHLDHHEDLYEPSINIPVGAALLKKLQGKYKGNFVLTAAAYNANERAIENWLKTRLREDTLEFIEDIPYDETRSYVKLVMRNFIFYSRLKNPSQKMPFPKWCIEDLQSFKVSLQSAPISK